MHKQLQNTVGRVFFFPNNCGTLVFKYFKIRESLLVLAVVQKKKNNQNKRLAVPIISKTSKDCGYIDLVI
jgi:hypothetical protein